MLVYLFSLFWLSSYSRKDRPIPQNLASTLWLIGRVVVSSQARLSAASNCGHNTMQMHAFVYPHASASSYFLCGVHA